MAIIQGIVDRKKAEGFFKHIEWRRMDGVLVKTYDKNENGVMLATFERGSHDVEYDQRINDYRQFFLTRVDFVKFMLRAGFSLTKIAKVMRNVDGCQVVTEVMR